VENAYLVRQRDRRLLREFAGLLAAVLLLGGGLLSYTWMHIEILRTGYRVNSSEKALHRLLEKERRLRLDVSHLSHPEEIRRRAGQELGMASPTLEQTLFLAEIAPSIAASAREGGR
jgi:hypothetical protein